LSLFGKLLVDVTPEPPFVRLRRADDRMTGAVEMFGGVAIFGGIAAADVSALQAGPEVNPGVAHGDALGAEMRRGSCVAALGKVFAECHLGFLISGVDC
jgi:hypothetical protein